MSNVSSVIESGAPIGLRYRETAYAADVFDTYFFEKNLQGDIVAVYNSAGTKIGTYAYDAWGACRKTQITSGITASERLIVVLYNPFRYRGYYYDTDIGMYYLQSRYYHPDWGRFLNADGYVSTGTGLLGYNMFAYCNNNPIAYVDSTGHGPISALLFVFFAVVGGMFLTSCDTVSNEKVDSPSSIGSDPDDTSWADVHPATSPGRHKTFEGALKEATDRLQRYANNHNKEVGVYIYEWYGGYYVSHSYSATLATDHSVLIDYTDMHKDATLKGFVHSHPYHNDNILYTTPEYLYVVDTGVPSYVLK